MNTPTLHVRTRVQADGSRVNHTLQVRTHIQAGTGKLNHGLRVRTHIQAGGGKVNHGLRVRRASFALALASLGAAGCAETSSTDTNATTEEIAPLSPDGEHYGATYEAWATGWYAWVLEQPITGNPVFDDTGEDCGAGQPEDAWYLGGSFTGATVNRDCAVPADRPLVLPVVNGFTCLPMLEAIGYVVTDDEAKDMIDGMVVSATDLSTTIDGQAIAGIDRYHFGPTTFAVTLPDEDNFMQWNGVEMSGEVSPCYTSGYWLMFDPLPPGEHTLTFGATLPMATEDTADDFISASTYHLTVE